MHRAFTKILYWQCFALFIGISYCVEDGEGGNRNYYSLNHVEPVNIEDAVYTSVLQIVDQKFDSLSIRISSLERAVNGLQIFSIQQFKLISGNMGGYKRILQGMNAHMAHMDFETKAFKNGLILLTKDVRNLKKLNSQTYEALEENLVYINQNINNKVSELRNSMLSEETFKNISESANYPKREIDSCNTTLIDSMMSVKRQVDKLVTLSTKPKVNNSNKILTIPGQENVIFALKNISQNVVEGLRFHRHTDNLLERLVTAGEAYDAKQTNISVSVQKVLNSCVTDARKPESMNDKVIDQSAWAPMCAELQTSVKEMSQIVENGPELVELLTTLAQMSTESMKTSLINLQDSLLKLENIDMDILIMEIRTRLNSTEAKIETLLNKSSAVINGMDAVSTNTGWMPYLLTMVEYIQARVNKTADITLSRHSHAMEAFDEIRSKIKFGNMTNMDVESAKTILKLDRLLPALTRLVVEIDPMITLVNGTVDTEGRVEIFHKGRWGSICKPHFEHEEASAICKYLGFPGGIAVGPGYYGAGTGSFLSLDTKCLIANKDNCVSHSIKECTHTNDVSIKCDHMVRLVRKSGAIVLSTGIVEIFHNDNWRPIYDDHWSNRTVNVVCTQLGFTKGEALYGGEVSPETHPICLANITCTGFETRLDACSISEWDQTSNCTSAVLAAVSCS